MRSDASSTRRQQSEKRRKLRSSRPSDSFFRKNWLRGSRANRHARENFSPDGVRIDLQPASDFTNALGHARQAHSATGPVFPKALQNSRRHTAAVVPRSEERRVG